MGKRISPEVKAASVLLDALDRSSFDTSAFVLCLSMANLLLKERILAFMREFVEHNARLWDSETFPAYQDDFHRDCARMRDVLNLYR